MQPNNRNYNNTTSTVLYITNTKCSRKYHQCIQRANTTHKIIYIYIYIYIYGPKYENGE